VNGTGTMEMNGKTVDISLIMDNGKCLLTSNDLMLFEQPITELKFKRNIISFCIDIETVFRFEGVVGNGGIDGFAAIRDGIP